MSKTVLFQTIKFRIGTQTQWQNHFYLKQFGLAYVHNFNIKKSQFWTIQLSISTQFSSIWPISFAISPGQSWHGSNGNKDVLQHYWSLTICQDADGVFYSPNDTSREKLNLEKKDELWIRKNRDHPDIRIVNISLNS